MMFIGITAVLAIVSLSDAACVSDSYVNGCSVPLDVDFPYKKQFKPVCDRHDICYYCGGKYGWTQRLCDIAFKRDLYKKCEETYANRKRFFSKLWNAVKNGFHIGYKILKWPWIKGQLAKCKHGADIYYKAVDSFGHTAYVHNSPAWCNEACARRKGDPYL